MIKYLSNEYEYLPWNVTLNSIKFYENLLGLTELYGDLRSFVLGLIKPVYLKLTWSNNQNDTHLNK